jgi:hypothetical protein
MTRRPRAGVADEPQYSFKHVLIRDVAYAGTPRAGRSAKHHKAAEWIEARSRNDDVAELVAHHYELSGPAWWEERSHIAVGWSGCLQPAALRRSSKAASPPTGRSWRSTGRRAAKPFVPRGWARPRSAASATSRRGDTQVSPRGPGGRTGVAIVSAVMWASMALGLRVAAGLAPRRSRGRAYRGAQACRAKRRRILPDLCAYAEANLAWIA